MLNEKLGNLSIELLMKTPIGTEIGKALSIMENLQKNLCALSNKRGEKPLTALKCGTILTFSILKKAISGKNPKAYDRGDWEEIGKAVSEFSVCYDNQQYSEFVFLLYAEYIDHSADLVENRISAESVSAIHGCADLLRAETTLLREGTISEAEYIERCLWTSLEAMLKLLASMVSVVAGEDAEQLAQAVTSFAFEYGRYVLFLREQSALSEYLIHQAELDNVLQEQYEVFLTELQKEADEFLHLLDKAFDPSFSELLKNSAQLARAAGVAENEILDSQGKIDDFFLN